MIKPKKCKVCKNDFIPVSFAQSVCGYKCAIIYSNNLKKEKEINEWKAEKAVLRHDLKTMKEFEYDARKSFQKWVRMRDKDMPCISCGIEQTELWDGGHYKKAEMYTGVIFDENNCHKQCRKCNRFLGGNELNFREGLIQRYSLEYVESIELKANELRKHKFTREELVDIKLKYNILLKELK